MDELLHGSPGHRPITARELAEWEQVWLIRSREAERAAKRRGR